ncbi:hypothetical protein [Nostoc sp. FACHB-280]|uniref:hypothetical protein n=1 Tax=Nostoc sp. FACHB-280 TaxID=2692839 RepID=UPI00168C0609|nr:hypothetical protein [Nostoc sp. FACHB-280]MBD2496857.1 hypothetical protein [Nostoc sp. FACHB-280]
MNIRRVLGIAIIPLMIGTSGFVGTNSANADATSVHNTNITGQPITNKKPQIKRRQVRPQAKKNLPQSNRQNPNSQQDLNSHKKDNF